MGVSAQLHAPATLLPGYEPSVPGWAPDENKGIQKKTQPQKFFIIFGMAKLFGNPLSEQLNWEQLNQVYIRLAVEKEFLASYYQIAYFNRLWRTLCCRQDNTAPNYFTRNEQTLKQKATKLSNRNKE
jgi:hypothetical protein